MFKEYLVAALVGLYCVLQVMSFFWEKSYRRRVQALIDKALSNPSINEWERGFVENLNLNFDPVGLSDTQMAKLEEIAVKCRSPTT